MSPRELAQAFGRALGQPAIVTTWVIG